jgi:uncharacterized protein
VAGVRIAARVKPRSSRSRILRAEGLSVEVALSAPPVDGAANAELIALLASALRVPKSALSVVIGHSSRSKVVQVEGLDAPEVERRLAVQP